MGNNLKKHRTIAGFSTVEFMIVVGVGFALVAGGGYAWRHQQAHKVQAAPSQVALDSMHDDGFMHLKEWHIKAPYTGLLHFSYAISGNTAAFSSRELTALDKACAGKGGQIVRFAPNDDITPTGSDGVLASSLSQLPRNVNSFALAAVDGKFVAVPGDGSRTFKEIGGYYYVFMHEQSACGSELDVDQTAAMQQQTNDEVKALVPTLRTQ
ncbi:MAG TPA: hypothetical protein VLI54_04605 [Bacillota bacterium]|nr:hypothetical protein [Bacillota bacterium]